MTEIIRAPRRAPHRGMEYATSDGKPMAETDLHRDLAVYVIEALKLFFAKRADVYVSGNNFVYYRENPRRCLSPDAYVVYGVAKHPRDCYVAAEEDGKLPAVVFEFTSKSTSDEDETVKKPRYEKELCVPEYFRFDPTGDYLSPRLQGFRLIEGQYVPLELVDGRLHSEQLGLDLVQDDTQLRLYDPANKKWLPTSEEREAALEAAERAREVERQAGEAERRAREAAEQAYREETVRRIAAEHSEEAARAEIARLTSELDKSRRGLAQD